MKILVIDDNATDRKLFTDVLHHAGFEVIPAESAEEALAVLSREAVDVILTDVLLPGMDGLNLVARLKTESSTRDIPIIVTSSVTEWPFGRLALNCGCHGFLQKPVDTRRLAEVITAACLR